LYSAVLSIGVAVPQSRREITTLVAGAAGTLVAFLQILDHFLTFLFYLSIVFVPIASIIIVDFFLLRPAAYTGAAINSIKAVETAALIAWAGGACVAVLGSVGVLRLTGIAAVDAMLVSALAYGVLRWRPAAAVSEPM
jgi:cytosine permease